MDQFTAPNKRIRHHIADFLALLMHSPDVGPAVVIPEGEGVDFVQAGVEDGDGFAGADFIFWVHLEVLH